VGLVGGLGLVQVRDVVEHQVGLVIRHDRFSTGIDRGLRQVADNQIVAHGSPRSRNRAGNGRLTILAVGTGRGGPRV
jgi:hypothetical protein